MLYGQRRKQKRRTLQLQGNPIPWQSRARHSGFSQATSTPNGKTRTPIARKLHGSTRMMEGFHLRIRVTPWLFLFLCNPCSCFAVGGADSPTRYRAR